MMCEINPRRKRVFDLEFFAAHHMTDERWDELTVVQALEIEQRLNETGEIRVHVHEREDEDEDEDEDGASVIGRRVWIKVGEEAKFPEHGKIIATGLLTDGQIRYYVVEVGDGDARVIFNGDFNFDDCRESIDQ